MTKFYSYAFIVAIIVIVTVLVLNHNINEPTSDKSLRNREDSLQQLLVESEKKRLVLGNYLDSLNRANENLVRMNSKYDSILTKIKGSYNKLKPTELGNEMIRRYNAR